LRLRHTKISKKAFFENRFFLKKIGLFWHFYGTYSHRINMKTNIEVANDILRLQLKELSDKLKIQENRRQNVTSIGTHFLKIGQKRRQKLPKISYDWPENL
jgi:hypothetical protein